MKKLNVTETALAKKAYEAFLPVTNMNAVMEFHNGRVRPRFTFSIIIFNGKDREYITTSIAYSTSRHINFNRLKKHIKHIEKKYDMKTQDIYVFNGMGYRALVPVSHINKMGSYPITDFSSFLGKESKIV